MKSAWTYASHQRDYDVILYIQMCPSVRSTVRHKNLPFQIPSHIASALLQGYD